MRQLANPCPGDPTVVGGECAGGAVGALLALSRRPDLRERLEMTTLSSVLVIGTEGATDPEIYQEVVGRGAEQVSAGGPR